LTAILDRTIDMIPISSAMTVPTLRQGVVLTGIPTAGWISGVQILTGLAAIIGMTPGNRSISLSHCDHPA
jgi:hypothetical protein